VPPRGNRTSDWALAAYYASLAMIIPGGAVAGYLAGWYLDRYTGLSPVLAVVGAIAGAASGVAEVLQIISRTERNAGRNAKPDDHNEH
jgi:F0F1-type ATP synthase assembly protein I